MKKCFILTLVSMIFLMSFTIRANTWGPEKCPSAEAIRNGGIAEIRRLSPPFNYKQAITQSRYDTENEWEFSVGLFQAYDDTVRAFAYKILAGLSGNPVPNWYDRRWVCRYNIENFPITAEAYTSKW